MTSAHQNLRRLRAERNYTQAKLARLAGMSPAQLCKIEAGRSGITAATLSRLADALDVPVSQLLGEGRPAEAPAPVRAEAPAGPYVPVLAPVGTESELETILSRVREWDGALAEAEDARGFAVRTALQLVYPYGCREETAPLLARDLRVSLGLGRQPVANFDAVLERAGVRVVPVAGASASFQSASYYNPARRTFAVAINESNTPERRAYRLVYELGGAVLFASSDFRTVADEGPAHRFLRAFAADFLMPEETVRSEVSLLGLRPDEWTLRALVYVKERFCVSAEAFALRLESLGLIEPSLRHAFRDDLRARYRSHPRDMEPHPDRRRDNRLTLFAKQPSRRS